MSRIRTVKPEFFASLSIAELSIPARLHFIGLWTHADDDGRAEDEPRLLKAALWPLDDHMTPAKIEAIQEELATHGKIVRYFIQPRRYCAIVNFSTHQKIDRKRASKLPAPPDRDLDEASSNHHRANSEGSLPDNGSRDQVSGSRDQVSGGSIEPSPSAPRESSELEFAAFWNRYPASRRVAKAKCLITFSRAVASGVDAQTIVDGIDRWATYWVAARTEEQYIPHARTWLSDGRWDTPPPSATTAPVMTKTTKALAAVLSRADASEVIDVAEVVK